LPRLQLVAVVIARRFEEAIGELAAGIDSAPDAIGPFARRFFALAGVRGAIGQGSMPDAAGILEAFRAQPLSRLEGVANAEIDIDQLTFDDLDFSILRALPAAGGARCMVSLHLHAAFAAEVFLLHLLDRLARLA